jgi:hypothetical protein
MRITGCLVARQPQGHRNILAGLNKGRECPLGLACTAKPIPPGLSQAGHILGFGVDNKPDTAAASGKREPQARSEERGRSQRRGLASQQTNIRSIGGPDRALQLRLGAARRRVDGRNSPKLCRLLSQIA